MRGMVREVAKHKTVLHFAHAARTRASALQTLIFLYHYGDGSGSHLEEFCGLDEDVEPGIE
jgi:hypothetical protein